MLTPVPHGSLGKLSSLNLNMNVFIVILGHFPTSQHENILFLLPLELLDSLHQIFTIKNIT